MDSLSIFMREIYISKPDNRLAVKEIYEDFRAWVIGKHGMVTWNKISQRQVYAAFKELPDYIYMRFKEGYCLKGIAYKDEKMSQRIFPQMPHEILHEIPHEIPHEILKEATAGKLFLQEGILLPLPQQTQNQVPYLMLNVIQTTPITSPTNSPPVNDPKIILANTPIISSTVLLNPTTPEVIIPKEATAGKVLSVNGSKEPIAGKILLPNSTIITKLTLIMPTDKSNIMIKTLIPDEDIKIKECVLNCIEKREQPKHRPSVPRAPEIIIPRTGQRSTALHIGKTNQRK